MLGHVSVVLVVSVLQVASVVSDRSVAHGVYELCLTLLRYHH